MNDDLSKLHSILKDFSTAMLVTHDDSGLRARPMAIAEVEDTCVLWFITYRESAKAHEVEAERQVSVICQKDHTAYLSINGVAQLNDQRAKIAEVWKEPFKVWFPEGKDDPDIVLIRVEPKQAEYWDNRGLNKVQYLVRAATAYLGGVRPNVAEGQEHGVMNL